MGCQGLPLDARLTHSGLWGGRGSGLADGGWISAKGIQLAWRSINTNMGTAAKELLKLLPGAPVLVVRRGGGGGRVFLCFPGKSHTVSPQCLPDNLQSLVASFLCMPSLVLFPATCTPLLPVHQRSALPYLRILAWTAESHGGVSYWVRKYHQEP